MADRRTRKPRRAQTGLTKSYLRAHRSQANFAYYVRRALARHTDVLIGQWRSSDRIVAAGDPRHHRVPGDSVQRLIRQARSTPSRSPRLSTGWVANGVHAIAPLGGTGERSRRVDGRVAVVVGVSDLTTANTTRRA